MGSFSDVPMYPTAGAPISRKDALTQQWDLTQQLGEAIKQIVAET